MNKNLSKAEIGRKGGRSTSRWKKLIAAKVLAENRKKRWEGKRKKKAKKKKPEQKSHITKLFNCEASLEEMKKNVLKHGLLL